MRKALMVLACLAGLGQFATPLAQADHRYRSYYRHHDYGPRFHYRHYGGYGGYGGYGYFSYRPGRYFRFGYRRPYYGGYYGYGGYGYGGYGYYGGYGDFCW